MFVGAGFPIKEIGMVRWLRMAAVVVGGHHSGHTVFRRCEAPEKVKYPEPEAATASYTYIF